MDFNLTIGAARFSEGEWVVYPNRKVFECGDYPDKEFSLSPEEALAAALDFTDAPLDLDHRETVLSNEKIGKARNLKIAKDSDGKPSLFADIAINALLDPLLKDDAKMSATWDREKKRLVAVALTLNPRIKDTQLRAAFSQILGASDGAEEAEDKKMDVTFKEMFESLVSFFNHKSDAEPKAEEKPKAEFSETEVALIRETAESYATDLIGRNKATPGEKDQVIAGFIRARMDDLRDPQPVTFGEAKEESRLALFKKAYEARGAVEIDKEVVTGDDKKVLFDDPKKAEEDRKRELYNMTPLGRLTMSGKGG